MPVHTAHELAPGGTLRAALNLGNPVLAHSLTANERPAGVSIDLARRLSAELELPLQLIEHASAGQALATLAAGGADIGFMAIDPQRAGSLHFTPAYVEIEGNYLVRDASPLRQASEVDRAGTRIVVGAASAYALHLSRSTQHAELVPVPRSEDVVTQMLERGLEAAAGVRQTLEAEALRLAGLRLLEPPFMVIHQAMAMPVAGSSAAHVALDDFVRRMLTSGFVAEALVRHGIQGARVAPSENA